MNPYDLCLDAAGKRVADLAHAQERLTLHPGMVGKRREAGTWTYGSILPIF